MKSGLFMFSLGLLVLAFIAGASEIAAQGIGGGLRVWMSALEVWQTLSPETLLATEAGFGQTSPGLWKILHMLMVLPGWLLFGLPGFVMAMTFRDRDTNEDLEHEETIFLYDELSRRAEEEGMSDPVHGDDFMPHSHVPTEPADLVFADERVDPEPENESSEPENGHEKSENEEKPTAS